MAKVAPLMSRFDLDRFVSAQAPVMAQVRRELAAGAKRTHWMWFVFPQLRALGRSATAQHYGSTGSPRRRPISRMTCSGRDWLNARFWSTS